jgi:hypothetical protein
VIQSPRIGLIKQLALASSPAVRLRVLFHPPFTHPPTDPPPPGIYVDRVVQASRTGLIERLTLAFDPAAPGPADVLFHSLVTSPFPLLPPAPSPPPPPGIYVDRVVQAPRMGLIERLTLAADPAAGPAKASSLIPSLTPSAPLPPQVSM